jgi:hypothetical protein
MLCVKRENTGSSTTLGEGDGEADGEGDVTAGGDAGIGAGEAAVGSPAVMVAHHHDAPMPAATEMAATRTTLARLTS